MTIGVLARQAGVPASAIRYYERVGVLPAPLRRSGRRDYDPDAVAHLAVVQFALTTGFSLRETRQLVRGFSKTTRADARWRALATEKATALDALILRANTMKVLLERVSSNCHCETLVECGRAMAKNRARWADDTRISRRASNKS